MSLTLFAYPGDFRAYKAQIAANYVGVTLNTPEFKQGEHDVAPEFAAKNPLGRVPLLETSEGCIFESNAIARYIAGLRRDSELLGASYFESGLVDSWLDFCSNEVELPATMWVYPVLGLTPFDAATFNGAKSDLFASLKTLERHLLANTFLVGEGITLADIVTVAALFNPFKFVLDGGIRRRFPSVVRWFTTCVNQPEFARTLGSDVVLCAKQLQPAGAKGGKGKGKGKGKQQQKQGKKKQQKKAAAPKPKKAAEPPKPEDALKKLPRSKLSLDAALRNYMSTDPNFYESMPAFWEMLDTEGWSVWICDYKYNDENKRGFMTSNAVAGFMQRSTGISKKFGFGVMQILEGPPFKVMGCWLLRGQDVAPMISVNPDAEYYAWTKVDPTNAEQKETVGHLWCAREGAEILGGKVYDTKDSVTC